MRLVQASVVWKVLIIVCERNEAVLVIECRFMYASHGELSRIIEAATFACSARYAHGSVLKSLCFVEHDLAISRRISVFCDPALDGFVAWHCSHADPAAHVAALEVAAVCFVGVPFERLFCFGVSDFLSRSHVFTFREIKDHHLLDYMVLTDTLTGYPQSCVSVVCGLCD